MKTTIIRSRRKTLSIEVRADGVVVRAPLRLSEERIAGYLQKHSRWIEEKLRQAQAQPAVEPLTEQELRALAKKAHTVIPERVRYYAPLVGVTVGRVTIRSQRTRWGSCSSKGNLNFNCLLLLAPPEALDSVIVHELCHRKQPNHSPRFYAEVLRVFPDYYKWDAWLKKNGAALLNRLPQT